VAARLPLLAARPGRSASSLQPPRQVDSGRQPAQAGRQTCSSARGWTWRTGEGKSQGAAGWRTGRAEDGGRRFGALFGLIGSMLSELITNWSLYANNESSLRYSHEASEEKQKRGSRESRQGQAPRALACLSDPAFSSLFVGLVFFKIWPNNALGHPRKLHILQGGFSATLGPWP
jgi:hypothetical protein